MSKDMTRPNWKRTSNRLRKMAETLKAYDFQVIEPPDFDKPPAERYAQGGIVKDPGRVYLVGESGPEHISPRRSGDHGLS
jgi:hypothetical protein